MTQEIIDYCSGTEFYIHRGKYFERLEHNDKLFKNLDDFMFDYEVHTICPDYKLLDSFKTPPPELDHAEEFIMEGISVYGHYGDVRALTYHPYMDKSLSTSGNVQHMLEKLKKWMIENEFYGEIQVDEYSWYSEDCLCVTIIEKPDDDGDYDPDKDFTF